MNIATKLNFSPKRLIGIVLFQSIQILVQVAMFDQLKSYNHNSQKYPFCNRITIFGTWKVRIITLVSQNTHEQIN